MRFARHFPEPGSDEERHAFAVLQAKLPAMYHKLERCRTAPHTTVVVPSLSMDAAELAKIDGTVFYEERLLCMLMLLRRPRTRIVFVSSTKIHPIITQYYLNFCSGIPFGHAVKRLTMLDTGDTGPKPLTQNILESPWLLDRIAKAVGDPENAHLVVFNTTHFERTLAVRLGIPVYGLDPDLLSLGSKSGCRHIFRESGVPYPAGFEDLTDADDIVEALDNLWRDDPDLLRAVVKLNEGFSGQGNAIFDFRKISDYRGSSGGERKRVIRDSLFDLKFEAKNETWPNFESQFRKLHGVVEAFIEGEVKYSPSVQARVNAIREPQVISTHDQVLGGPTGQVFMGCNFPARMEYRKLIQYDGMKVAQTLADKGVLGRFAIDFIIVPRADGTYDRYAIEINLRKGGTTHPFLMMKFLIPGDYDEENGIYVSRAGEPKFYHATDNLLDPNFVGIGPEDLIDMAVFHELHFNTQSQRGIAFHMIGALSQFGKVGITSIGDSPEEAREFHRNTLDVLEREVTPEGRQERMRYFWS